MCNINLTSILFFLVLQLDIGTGPRQLILNLNYTAEKYFQYGFSEAVLSTNFSPLKSFGNYQQMLCCIEVDNEEAANAK